MTTIAKSTEQKYLAFLKILEGINIKNKDEVDKFLQNRNIKDMSKNGYYSAILYKLNNEKDVANLIKEYKENIRINKEEDDSFENKNILRQGQKFIEWKTIMELRDKFLNEDLRNVCERKSFDHLKQSLIILMFTEICPRRPTDFNLMKYILTRTENNMNQEFNYYIKNEKVFVFNNYKTKKSYESVEIKTTDLLEYYLNLYITKFNIKENDLLLNYKNPAGITMNIQSAFNFGPNELRHSYCSMISRKPNITLEERKKIALEMGHSVMSQLKYIKYNEPIINLMD